MTQSLTKNKKLLAFVDEAVKLCKPANVHWVDGSDKENQELCDLLVKGGTFEKLNEKKRPNSYIARSHPSDVARVEKQTYVCPDNKEDAGPNNNWTDPTKMRATLKKCFDGCMEGRTLYIIPFCMGPLDAAVAKVGIEITDSAYVVVNMRIMTRAGKQALDKIGENGDFIPCMHSIGAPLKKGQKDTYWPCEPNPENKYIVHFPQDPSIWSYGSGYGGNALLGKKCLALRIASCVAKREGWMAEHMLILCLTSPEGKKYYVCAAFPSACGKTNLAMMEPTIPGWKVTVLGDDIAWLRVGEDGRLYAVNPEVGFFGVAPGTSEQTNPNAMKSFEKNSIFTNVALTPDKDIWWEDMGIEAPDTLIDWKFNEWKKGSDQKAAHPNARFTAPASQCPVIDPDWENPKGVPVSAFLFGGRRQARIPLVNEAFDWEHGVFLGATAGSEKTAAALDQGAALRRDPFAMLPFCGYNMADYFAHWLSMPGRTEASKLPKIYFVNWFRKSPSGKWLWPGYGENSRVLKWVCERIEGTGKSVETPVGNLPSQDGLDISNLDINEDDLKNLLNVDIEDWKKEAEEIEAYFDKEFGPKLPQALREQLNALKDRLSKVNV